MEQVVGAAPSERIKGVTLVFMAGILWSTVGLGIRLIEDALVWQILLYRSLSLSVLLYLVIRLRSGADPFRLAIGLGWPGLVAALALVGAYSGGIYAIRTTSVANAMLLFATAPLMAAILARIVLGEAVQRRTWIAMGFAGIGVIIMVWDKFGGAALGGNLAALGSSLGFAVFTVALRRGRAGDMMPAVFLSGVLAIVMMASLCMLMGLPLVLSPRDGGIALGMGVFQIGAGLILFTLGSRSVPAAELTLLSMAEVVLGPFWVWLLLGETATGYTIVGGAVLLAAIAGNALAGARRKPPPIM